MLASKASAERRVGSTPTRDTKINVYMAKIKKKVKFVVLTKEQVESDRSNAWQYLI